MPSITCPKCSAQYRIDEANLGKKVTCKKCDTTFTLSIPRADNRQQTPAPSDPIVCSACGQLLASNAVLCVHCGLDLRSGTKLSTQIVSDDSRTTDQKSRKPGTQELQKRGMVALIAIVVIFGLVWQMQWAGPASKCVIPAWAASYVPTDATGIIYVNLEKAKKSEFYRVLSDTHHGRSPLGGFLAAMPAQSALDTYAEVLAIETTDKSLVFAIRMTFDISLESMVASLKAVVWQANSTSPPIPKPFGNVQGMALPTGLLAKTDRCTFLVASKEEVFKTVLGQWERKETPPLRQDLQQLLDRTHGDHFIVDTSPTKTGQESPFQGTMPGMPLAATPKWDALGLSLDTRITLAGAVGFANAGDAEKTQKQFDEAFNRLDTQYKSNRSRMPTGIVDALDKGMSMIHSLHIYADGNTLQITGTWKVKELEDIMEKIETFARGERRSGKWSITDFDRFGNLIE